MKKMMTLVTLVVALVSCGTGGKKNADNVAEKEQVVAERLLQDLQKSILSLNTMPKRVALVEEEPWRSYGIHKMPVKNFLVYFWINEEMKEVHITAVIYGKRDQLEQLKQMDI